MAANIDDRNSKYQQALTAYTEGNYKLAATLIDQAVHSLPDEPNSHLLRGYIYYVLQQFDIAQAEYEQVFHLTDDQEILGSATNYLESIKQYFEAFGEDESTVETNQQRNHLESNGLVMDEADLLDLGVMRDLDNANFDLKSFGDYEASQDSLEDMSLSNPFISDLDSINLDKLPDNSIDFGHDPFALDQPFSELGATSNDAEVLENSELPLTLDQPFSELGATSNDAEASKDLELPPFWQEGISSEENIGTSVENSYLTDLDANSEQEISLTSEAETNSPFLGKINLSGENNWASAPELMLEQDSPDFEDMKLENLKVANNSQENINVVIEEHEINNDLNRHDLPDSSANTFWNRPNHLREKKSEEFEPELDTSTQISSSVNNNFADDEQGINLDTKYHADEFDDDHFDLEAFESAFGSESFTTDEEENPNVQGENSPNNMEFLGDFDEFDDLGSIPSFNLTGESEYREMSVSSPTRERSNTANSSFSQDFSMNSVDDDDIDRNEELFTITGAQEAVPVFTQPEVSKLEPNVSVEQGLFGFFENASLDKKQWYIASTVGLTSAVVAALVSFGATTFSPPDQRESVRNTGWAMALAAGLAGGMTAGFMGNLTLKQIRRTTKDLQAQFDAVREGNLNAQATVYSEDELGYLATSFNDMARVIFMTTNEAQRKAVEQEEAKENLQRQVIRLLDDVEGAARGDLTVQAEVTADVLGAVADAFNLTIQNLRDIVKQVKMAAREVTKGSTNSETFARALSGYALRQAEELAVTLNSVQVMTESIKRVADAAKEAEVVARDASVIAVKGGEAVENTVAGILEIRETVAETTRKVKRLAESSQEINSIVALVSQIASRTNLLALNASIEAARAGEAGRGFAIVADEVRQLADKSAKSLKEIEQIVMQIQSDTGSVMTAMEEGTQQVIQGTKLAEEAKRSVEDIIEVAGHIDSLVRSITADTVEQTETSLAVAQVMQSVELTAQETSQEAQRVSGALQHLVGVSRDLIASVESFRVETIESR
ncbi:methyl-accepting chemotaxis sensory transducer [Sphaerospermopsis reniformis]|uniref:Methyl-accepting chemotaxis sensory transducer n=1 Tax=Sphaerospermopsis reniformis TaxID=531300 RepID=A0A480A307_9CYAN|nr:methyl-accepting chemotaxis protein [Sphaerospermopsis reniformis]GCL39189.1 methyl-accepting chemotaxis sensory transducer [Sphaerospermopsis reniformis]